MKHGFFRLAVGVAAAGAATAGAGAQVRQAWAASGSALAPIVIPADPLPAEAFAADELQKYLNAVTSAGFEIRRGLAERPPKAIVLAVLNRPAVAAALPAGLDEGIRADGYRWKSEAESLYIVARNPFGVVFGVYEYLRTHAGAVFLEYAAWGEEVPPAAKAAHAELAHEPLDHLRNPRLALRGMRGWSLQRIDWMAKNGFNCVEGRSFRPILPELEKRGMQFEAGPHTFGNLLPRDTIKEHLDYYALIQGQRGVTGAQLGWCLSNPDLQQSVARALTRWADESPPDVVPSLGLMPGDGKAPLCECERCRAWIEGAGATNGKAYAYLQFVNDIAGRVREAHPERHVSMLAYGDLIDPPASLRPGPQVRVLVCPWGRCARHALHDAGCPRNKAIYNPLKVWLDITPGQWVYLYEYYMGMSTWDALPYPTLTSLFAEWSDLAARGVKGAIVQCGAGNHGTYGINFAAFARLAWEPAPTLDEYLAEYCAALYGEAAGPAAAVFRLWEEAVQATDHIEPVARTCAHRIFTPAILERWDQLLAEARACARTDRVRWRLERLDVIRRYTAWVVRVTEQRAAPSTPEAAAEGRRLIEALARFSEETVDPQPDLLGVGGTPLADMWRKRLVGNSAWVPQAQAEP